jgi:UDP-N-acetylmuramoyl-tripeptide--D-alanyl-D-alanine ligase
VQAQLRSGDVVLLKSSRDAGLRWLGDRLAGIEVPQ